MKKIALTAVLLATNCTKQDEPIHVWPAKASIVPEARAAGKTTPASEPTTKIEPEWPCGSGMVYISGEYCPSVEENCLEWMDDEKMRCARFGPTRCKGKTVHKEFCIDQFEFPNAPGEEPVVMVTWNQARAACEARGKRLPTDSEWTMACEGPRMKPYPYGYTRDDSACVIDKDLPKVDEKMFATPRAIEYARTLWLGEPSGSRDACVSDYGVRDMTGNVDEWVVNESGRPYISGLKGGYWGKVRTRCRPMTVAHGPEFRYYQIGFRCVMPVEQ